MRCFNQIVLVAGMLVLTSCQSPQERVWLDDIEQIPVSPESSNSDPSLYTDEPLNFEDYFEYVGETQLSDEVVLGGMTGPTVGPQGQILMLDSEQAVLFDPDGNVVTRVSPELCHPGFDFQPRKAQFLSDGGFLVVTNMAQGFWFDADGQCTTKLSHQVFQSHFGLKQDSSMVTYRVNRSDWRITRYGPSEKDVDNLFTGFPPRLLSRYVGGGMVPGNQDDWFIAASHSPFVYRFREGRFEKLGYIPPYYNPIQTDLTEEEQTNVQAMMNRMSLILKESSSTGWLSKLDEDLLVLRYLRVEDGTADKQTPGALHIMDFDGNPITKGPLFLGELNPFYFANGSMYLREYDQSGLDDAPLNPKSSSTGSSGDKSHSP